MCSCTYRSLGLPIYVARVPAAPFSLLPSKLYLLCCCTLSSIETRSISMLVVVTLTALPSLFLGRSVFVSRHTASDIHLRAEIRSGQKGKIQKREVIV